MAHFFAALLALLQPAAPSVAPFDQRWSVAFDSAPATTPGFDAATAYVPLKGGQLVAVSLDHGTIRWRVDVSTVLTPATGDGLVYIVSEHAIEARDASTGEVRWRSPLAGGAALPLYFDTGWLIASTTTGDLAAFRASDGTLVWRQALGAPLSAMPGPALDRLYLPLTDNRLVAVLLASGETVWSRMLAAPIRGLLALDDQIVFGTAAKQMTSVDLRNGRERWTWPVGGDVSGAPTADGKRIYFAARDNTLRAVDRGSGNLRWKANLSSRPVGGPLMLGPITLPETLLMPLVSGEISGFDPETGQPTVTVRAAGEIGTQPHLRTQARITLPRVITVNREGHLQGFARRIEPAPQLLDGLPGSPAVP
jgi:outer membrane protein assembly factor BamB